MLLPFGLQRPPSLPSGPIHKRGGCNTSLRLLYIRRQRLRSRPSRARRPRKMWHAAVVTVPPMAAVKVACAHAQVIRCERFLARASAFAGATSAVSSHDVDVHVTALCTQSQACWPVWHRTMMEHEAVAVVVYHGICRGGRRRPRARHNAFKSQEIQDTQN